LQFFSLFLKGSSIDFLRHLDHSLSI
jgi:hypothetical protein